MFKKYQELKTCCESNAIEMIDFKMVDLKGKWRHLTIPASRLSEKLMADGVGFDGSNYGFAPVEKSDMVFIPDISTACMEPFTSIKTLTMIGDVHVIGDTLSRFDQDPRHITGKAEEYMKKTGVADEIRIGPEFEFYVFDSVGYEVTPQGSGFFIDAGQAEWNSMRPDGRGFTVPHKGGYHITAPMDKEYDLRGQICELLEERGILVKYHHTEVGGPGQQEIEVEFGTLREMADKTMMIKYIVQNAAFNAGKSATFMPKPLHGEAGSGMHVHMHMFKDGQPIFYSKDGYSALSDTALHFIGGLLRHGAALCGITNPSTNSYRRLIPGYEAPVSICYATSNRSAVIRIPGYARSPRDKRFEIRNPDATCNPYLAYAAILMAGMDGVLNKIDPVAEGYGPYDTNLYNLSPSEQAKIKALPVNLESALDALERDHGFLTEGGVFPQRLLETWIANKRREALEIGKTPIPSDFLYYYDM